MKGADPSGPLPAQPPAPGTGRWLDLPWVWAVPIVALAIAAWLGLRALAEQGPTIHIRFETGDGIEAGRTTVSYKNVVLGQVVRLDLSGDQREVVVTADMTREAKPLLRGDTQFWVVRPRVGLSGISGLSTLVSGAYIGMLPGSKGTPDSRDFTGLEMPPPQQGLVRGQEYTLVADKLTTLSSEAPVYYDGVQVGEVTAQKLSDRTGEVAIRIFIYDPHRSLIHANSRFWISSGLQLTVGAQGLKLGTASLQTLLSGGIVFDTPKPPFAGPLSPPGSQFTLYADEQAAEQAAEPTVSYSAYFPGAVPGLAVGTSVDLRGLPVGRVSAVRLEYDPATDSIRIPVTIDIAPGRILAAGAAGSSPLAPNENIATATNRMLDRLVAKGLRARLGTANLLTGARVVDLDFVANAPPAQLVYATPYPVLPTVAGSGVEDITNAAAKFLDTLSSLPLGALIGEVRDMVRHADAVVAAPELRHALKELDRTLANAEYMTRNARGRVGPLLDKLNTAARQLNGTLALLGNDPRSSVDLAHTLSELTDASRSVRVLADYLETHPSALIFGKSQDSAR